MTALIGWLGTLIVLSTYVYSVRKDNLRPFNIGNVVGAVFLAISNIAVGAWPATVVTICFGVIGLLGLLKEARTSRRKRRSAEPPWKQVMPTVTIRSLRD